MTGTPSKELSQRRKIMSNDNDMHLSNQAVGALMMALQRSLLEQSDIVPTLKGFKFRLSESGLMVMNPPTIKVKEDFEDAEV